MESTRNNKLKIGLVLMLVAGILAVIGGATMVTTFFLHFIDCLNP